MHSLVLTMTLSRCFSRLSAVVKSATLSEGISFISCFLPEPKSRFFPPLLIQGEKKLSTRKDRFDILNSSEIPAPP